jgi:hypothetical protein
VDVPPSLGLRPWTHLAGDLTNGHTLRDAGDVIRPLGLEQRLRVVDVPRSDVRATGLLAVVLAGATEVEALVCEVPQRRTLKVSTLLSEQRHEATPAVSSEVLAHGTGEVVAAGPAVVLLHHARQLLRATGSARASPTTHLVARRGARVTE